MKKIAIAIVAMALATSLLADFNTNGNQSATHIKTGNRNATLGSEAPFYNPAGTVWARKGLTFEGMNIATAQTDEIKSEEHNKTYENKQGSFLVPNFNITYAPEGQKWTIISNIGVAHGGGAGEFPDGTPDFETLAKGIAGAATPSSAYSSDIYFEGWKYSLTGGLGGAYEINKNVAVGGMVKYVRHMEHTEGYVKNLKNGNAAIDSHLASVDSDDVIIDYDASGQCFGFSAGLALRFLNEKLLIAQTYKHYTKLEVENESNKFDDAGAVGNVAGGSPDGDGGTLNGWLADNYGDGVKREVTYAPEYSLGISYMATDKLRVETDLNLFIYKFLAQDAADNYEDFNYNLGIGAEYQLNENWNLGTGFTWGFGTNLKDEYQNALEYSGQTLWCNAGVTYSPLPDKLDLILSYQQGVQIDNPIENKAGTEEYKLASPWTIAYGVAYTL